MSVSRIAQQTNEASIAKTNLPVKFTNIMSLEGLAVHAPAVGGSDILIIRVANELKTITASQLGSFIGGSGNRVLISSTNITASANMTISWDESLYNKIDVIVEDARIDTDAQNIHLQLGSADAATMYTTNEYHGIHNAGTTTWLTNASGAAFWNLTAAGTMGNAAGEFFQTEINIKTLTSANIGATVQAETLHHNTVGAAGRTTLLGRLEASAAIDTVRIKPATGNFVATGVIKLYGYKI